MPVSPALHVVCRAAAMTAVLASGLLAGCDESQQPTAVTLIQAASNPDGDGQQARASLAGGSLREQFQMYFGDRFAEEQKGLMQQPQVAQAQAPTF
ncbi:hypothetical protein [Variovorax soli]|uniref:hypothetical protein n=1 Tax=Variovorax soli TaxID=376815 RepID=UPI000838CD63|nr:hypothetical protein [Variovorax soli]